MTNAVSIAQGGTNNVTMRNRIINGAMMIDQRNAGAASSSPAAGSGYLVDRFLYSASQTSKFTAQQNQGSVTPPSGFINYQGLTSSSAYSIASGDYFLVGQLIEGLNIADLGWGTASAAPVTLSFWVRSSLTGTFGGVFSNSASNRSYPFTYTISSANTWEQKTITVAGDTSGTWLTTNGIGIKVWFGLGVGSTYSGTAGSWSGSSYLSATGATSVVGTNGATFYITGVQLEAGTTATPFENRLYGTELALCFRYFRQYSAASNPLTNAMIGYGLASSSTQIYRWGFMMDVSMRAYPTINFSSGVACWAGSNVPAATASTSYSNPNYVDMDITTTGLTFTANGVAKVYFPTTAEYVRVSAEL